MKKLICFLLVALMLLCCACDKDNNENRPQLDSALEAVNNQTKLECDYMLEITFGDKTVLYYAMGNAKWDRNEKVANAYFDQTYLGSSVVMENYFSGKEMVSVENGVPIIVERDGDILLSKFPYFKPMCAPQESKIEVGANSLGTTYSFDYADTKTLCENLLGGDVYALVPNIKKPQREKTQYTSGKCIYTEVDGMIASCRYEFDIKLYDTPMASANYNPPESDYTLDLHVTAKITYTDFGENVVIDEYSMEETSASSEDTSSDKSSDFSSEEEKSQ